jgi:hypothetical protein
MKPPTLLNQMVCGCQSRNTTADNHHTGNGMRWRSIHAET